ncbi:cytochrome P450 [Nocardia abscessus]|uniref:cytochrome P450 n=1 Tax=Nocardia abscessus TaxID=120957 RepID=UPI0024589B10|nr:cytochrome P450 [Nocardia abscessus]
MSTHTAVGRPVQRAWPIVGHGLALRSRPLEFFAELHRAPEPLARIRLGSNDAYLVTAPELIVSLLRGREAHSVEKGAFFEAMRALLGDGLSVSAEPKHLRHRRLMAPAFHHEKIAGYVRIMQQEADAMVDSWSDGARLELDDRLRVLAMRIVAKALFASELGEAVVAESLRSFPVIVDELPKRTMMPWLAHIPLRNRTFDAAVRRLSDAIDHIIAEYRTGGTDYGDLVSMLLTARFDDGTSLTDRELHDEVMTLYAAGFATTANTMAFAFYELARRADVRERVEEEVAEVLRGGPVTADNIQRLQYTERVMAETLRRYAPTWLGTRETIEELDLGGVPLPAGTTLFYSPYTLHNNPKYFDDPARFDPDRWTPEYRKTVTRSGVYQPFGLGNRNCIGEPFAWYEAVTILATVVARARLELVPGAAVHEVARATLEVNHLPVTVRLRNAALTTPSA